MKEENIISLLKRQIDENETTIKNESINIAQYFDRIEDYQLAENIFKIITDALLYKPKFFAFNSDFFNQVDIRKMGTVNLPLELSNDIRDVINDLKRNDGIQKVLFEGLTGSGKTETAKYVARILDKTLVYIDFSHLIENKLEQINEAITNVFQEINTIFDEEPIMILFDEIDGITLDRMNAAYGAKEMEKVTSVILKEIDSFIESNKDIVFIATRDLDTSHNTTLTKDIEVVVNFDKYGKEDLIVVANHYFSSSIVKFKGPSKDERLFAKIMKVSKELPYPNDLKNIIQGALVFQDGDSDYDYLRKFYNGFIGNIDLVDIDQLKEEGFTELEIKKLKNESKIKN